MMSHGFFSFHIVDNSPWPLYMSVGAFSFMTTLMEFMSLHETNPYKVLTVLLFTLMVFFGWTRDISSEGTFMGSHTLLVQNGLKMGFMLFVLSEIMFFISFFWSLFYFSMVPSISIGGWPPTGVSSVNPMEIPLLGSLLLMSSGISVTWSHYSMMAGKKNNAISSLIMTLCLGITFTILQLKEYQENSFSMSDCSYGSIFYMATGFHGLHVFIGSIFLSVCLVRICMNYMSKKHHLGYEFAIWYWHFVDVVWLVLYLFLYWWGW